MRERRNGRRCVEKVNREGSVLLFMAMILASLSTREIVIRASRRLLTRESLGGTRACFASTTFHHPPSNIRRLLSSSCTLSSRAPSASASASETASRTRLHLLRIATPNTRAMAAVAASTPAKGYFILHYEYVPDILEKRDPFRAGHIAGAKKMTDENKIVLAGAYTDPTDGAAFCFKDVTREDIEEYVKADPYFVNGLVSSYSIRAWNVVAGTDLIQ